MCEQNTTVAPLVHVRELGNKSRAPRTCPRLPTLQRSRRIRRRTGRVATQLVHDEAHLRDRASSESSSAISTLAYTCRRLAVACKGTKTVPRQWESFCRTVRVVKPEDINSSPRHVDLRLRPDSLALSNSLRASCLFMRGEAPLESNTSIRTQKALSSNRALGDHTLGKTLGAGDVDKVKLAYHNLTGEKVRSVGVSIAIPPVACAARDPRVNIVNTGTNGVVPTAEAAAKAASKEASKETRAIPEAALSMLQHHPCICGKRELITHTCHYYMVFGYVDSGQILDYIISRLRERVVRKFSRRIGSALNYSHRNNVHRELKIENIFISQTGNIKIIDFGLSDLYNPFSYLPAFSGSTVYTSPLPSCSTPRSTPGPRSTSGGSVSCSTCLSGKVSFNDQSVPALHSKIKRALNASSSNVQTDSAQARSPPVAHMLYRKPLRIDELDSQVIRGTFGFDLGAPPPGPGCSGHGGHSNASLASYDCAFSAGSGSGRVGGTPTSKKVPRFSGSDFYRRKLFSPGSSPPDTSTHRTPTTSSSRLVDMQSESADPTGGFHPLLSMYFLALEKLERERVYGPGHFASSQTSLLGKDDGPTPPPSALNPLPASATAKTNGRSSQPPQLD
ncbi:hypothetical protein DFH11DRAFT_1732746 [Phellopilus nigrolimitatus]|nr:hypothetical protein DFH11DRAFT_1732746 [Phellopilus nigrolimitatus]